MLVDHHIWCSTFALDPRELQQVEAEAARFEIPVYAYNIRHEVNTGRAVHTLLVTILLRVYFVYFLWIG